LSRKHGQSKQAVPDFPPIARDVASVVLGLLVWQADLGSGPGTDYGEGAGCRRLGYGTLVAPASGRRRIAPGDRTSPGRRAVAAPITFLGSPAAPAAPEGQFLVSPGKPEDLGSATMTSRFHPRILTATQRRVLHQLGPALARRRFYLGGGT